MCLKSCFCLLEICGTFLFYGVMFFQNDWSCCSLQECVERQQVTFTTDCIRSLEALIEKWHEPWTSPLDYCGFYCLHTIKLLIFWVKYVLVINVISFHHPTFCCRAFVAVVLVYNLNSLNNLIKTTAFISSLCIFNFMDSNTAKQH